MFRIGQDVLLDRTGNAFAARRIGRCDALADARRVRCVIGATVAAASGRFQGRKPMIGYCRHPAVATVEDGLLLAALEVS